MRLNGETRDDVERSASPVSASDEQSPAPGANALAYAGLFLFTILLYVRPNELYPATFGDLPIVKTVAICTVVVYLLTAAAKGRPVTVWPIEVKMVVLLFVLGVAFVPFAARPQDSIDLLSDTFSKVVIIFILMVNVVDTRGRLVVGQVVNDSDLRGRFRRLRDPTCSRRRWVGHWSARVPACRFSRCAR